MSELEIDINNTENADINGDDEATEEEKSSGAKLPITRIKKIMKTDPELNLASQDAVFLIAKATVSHFFMHLFFINCFICTLHYVRHI